MDKLLITYRKLLSRSLEHVFDASTRTTSSLNDNKDLECSELLSACMLTKIACQIRYHVMVCVYNIFTT